MQDEFFETGLAEQERARKYREAEESEQKRLKDIFPKLDVLRSNIEAGDRKVMMEFLTIAADSLRAFDAPPQEARESLADGLEKIRNNLEEAKGFLPIKRGERPVKWRHEQDYREFFGALAVEHCRYFEGDSLEEAISKVAENCGLTESLVRKRWKLQHKEAKGSLDSICGVLQQLGEAPPKRKRKPKRVR